MLNPIQLRTLTMVLRTRSFAAAGRILGYTGSAVSQQMAALEAAVGRELFAQGTGAAHPTDLALLLAERSRDSLTALATLDDELERMRSGRVGRVALGSFPTASEALVPPALAALAASHPGLRVDLDDGEPEALLPLLVAGRLDLALVFHYDLVPHRWPAACPRTPLRTEELLLVGGATAPPPPRLEDLADADWITTREGSAGALALERAGALAGFAPRIRFRTDDYAVVRALVSAGLGVALVPELAQPGRDGARATRLEGLPVRRHLSLLEAPGSRSPAVRPVHDAILAVAAMP